jgi:hypothetical protein
MARARRVLPEPPKPVNVTRRVSGVLNISCTCPTQPSLPMNRVIGVGSPDGRESVNEPDEPEPLGEPDG